MTDEVTGSYRHVRTSAPDTLYYVCEYHPAMNGTINIIDNVDDANVPASGVTPLTRTTACGRCDESAKYRRPSDWW